MGKSSASFNYSRKFWHLLGLLLPLFLYLDLLRNLEHFEDPTRLAGVILLVIGLVFLLILDYFRIRHDPFRKIFYRFFGKLMKEEESNRINATIPYFTANLVLYLFFSREMAVLSCIFLIFGDPFAAFVGIKFGKIRMKNGKSLEGFLAFLFFSFIFSVLFLWFHSGHTNAYDSFRLFGDSFNTNLLFVVTAGVVFAAIAEFFSSTRLYGFLDDNLIIPLVSAAGMSFAAFIFFDFPWHSLFYNPGDLFLTL